ncbi:hypothetical protein HY78_18930 [Rhizorhabdus wittichii DC-6]|nr:hypothetical protein HY78_18930 [Rhizorhabdus wittichii DC-6]
MSRDEQARARELLAGVFDEHGATAVANRIRRNSPEDEAAVSASNAITAIIEALRGASGGGAEGLRAIEAARKEWFCSGADCTEYDHGRDEGFELAIAAYRKAAPAAPGPADQPAENAKSSDEE